MPQTCREILDDAALVVAGLAGHVIDVVDIKKPDGLQYAINLSKVVSKLSPLIGNMIEFHVADVLNKRIEGTALAQLGKWIRQDPGFPDTVFSGTVLPQPGMEVKTWFPLATEITARFKDSQSHFSENQTDVCMVAWLPEYVFFGRPVVLDVFVDTGASIAAARDKHYHNPPDYIIFEPEDTAARTANLQQTNTNGYKFQGTQSELRVAMELVASWGDKATSYSTATDYQAKLRDLMGRYTYRLDTNYAKMDRIEHKNLELFKAKVLGLNFNGKTVQEWTRVIATVDEGAFKQLLADNDAR